MKTKDIIPYVVCIVLGFLLFKECNREVKPETIIKEVTVKVPEIIKQFDTIYKPIPTIIRETDTIILREFLSASDSLKIALYLNATADREYTQQFKDSAQEINVFSKVRGEMLAQSVDYRIFEREVSHTETIPQSRSLYLLPTVSSDLQGVRAGLGLLYQDKAKRLLYVGYDTDSYWTVGVGIKF